MAAISRESASGPIFFPFEKGEAAASSERGRKNSRGLIFPLIREDLPGDAAFLEDTDDDSIRPHLRATAAPIGVTDFESGSKITRELMHDMMLGMLLAASGDTLRIHANESSVRWISRKSRDPFDLLAARRRVNRVDCERVER